MSQRNMNVESKIYRQIVKGIGFYQNQFNRNPTRNDLQNFVQIMNENLVPVSNLQEKVGLALDKLTKLHVCVPLPENTFKLWDSNPTQGFVNPLPTRNLMTEARQFGLVMASATLNPNETLVNIGNEVESIGNTEDTLGEPGTSASTSNETVNEGTSETLEETREGNESAVEVPKGPEEVTDAQIEDDEEYGSQMFS